MGKIKKLPEGLISKIAAGQVIEKASSVVKELVENSIDADATRIIIEVEDAGLKKIRVIDNGYGMEREDVKKCLDRHVTSKISTLDDLLTIESMGFRGEALASIAAVSKITVKSKVEGEVGGTVITETGGKRKKVSSAGVPVGTEVIVEGLFYKVPARKKFLKSDQIELRHIVDVVTNAALAFPLIGFQLMHNERELINLPPNQSLNNRVYSLLGATTFNNFALMSYANLNYTVNGFISKPQFSSKSRRKQKVFVNRRRVRNGLITSAVEDAYGNLLGSRTFPIFILFLELPPSLVDVNVHPRKEEVGFHEEEAIFEAINTAVKGTLQREDLTFVKRGFSLPDEFFYDTELLPKDSKGGLLKDVGVDVLQIHNTYLITQTERGVLIVDQHAAHERVLYEQLLEAFESKIGEKYSEPLSESITFELSVSDSELLRMSNDTFTKLGFEIDDFGKNIFKLSAVPRVLKETNAVSLINEIIGEIIEQKAIEVASVRAKQILSHTACRSAIKSGTPLNSFEISDLLEKLSKTKTEYTCPHGRPVKVEIPLEEFNRMFKRG